jgi:hypothetical protein
LPKRNRICFSEINRRSIAANDARYSPQLASISHHCVLDDTTRRKSENCQPQNLRAQKIKSPAWPGSCRIFFDQLISRALRFDATTAKPFGWHCSCE